MRDLRGIDKNGRVSLKRRRRKLGGFDSVRDLVGRNERKSGLNKEEDGRLVDFNSVGVGA